MCLRWNTKSTNSLRESLTRKKEMTFYKLLRVAGGQVVTPYQEMTVKTQRGWFVSNRESKEIRCYEKSVYMDDGGHIYHGIHVFRKQLSITNYCKSIHYRSGEVARALDGKFTVKVTGHIDDFVAADKRSAAFMKIRISKKAIRQGVARMNRLRKKHIGYLPCRPKV